MSLKHNCALFQMNVENNISSAPSRTNWTYRKPNDAAPHKICIITNNFGLLCIHLTSVQYVYYWSAIGWYFHFILINSTIQQFNWDMYVTNTQITAKNFSHYYFNEWKYKQCSLLCYLVAISINIVVLSFFFLLSKIFHL